MIADIQIMKDMGFNMLRKHIKIEPLRWYYHCDRLGMLVWQDMINGGGKYDPLTVTAPLFTGINIKDDRYARFARQRRGRKEAVQAGAGRYDKPPVQLRIHSAVGAL